MREYIPQIIKKHFDISPSELSPLTGGERASVFRVNTGNEDLCIKFHSIDKERSVLGMEFKLMEKLGDLGIQTPRPMFLDKCGVPKEEGYEYLIMSFEQGRLLSKEWASLNKDEKKKISGKLLEILNTIKNVKVSRFGPLNHNLEGLHKTPRSYMQYEFEKFENSEVVNVVEERVFYSTKRKLLDFASTIKKPQCVHADYRLTNFIKRGSNLILFDFANSMSTDPTFDFVRFILTDFSKGLELTQEGKYLEQVYASDYYAGDDYARDKSMFLLLLSIRLSPWFYNKGDKKRLESYLNLMREHSK